MKAREKMVWMLLGQQATTKEIVDLLLEYPRSEIVLWMAIGKLLANE